MNKQEFMRLASAMKTYYPRDNLLPNQEAAQLWYEELNDLSYEAAVAALRMHVSTEKWPPTIAELRSNATKIIIDDNDDDWGVSWDECRKAIKHFGYYQEIEAMAAVSPITAAVIKRLGWKSLCISENEMADRANFRDIYKELSGKKMKYETFSDGLKTAIEKISGAPLLSVAQLDQGEIIPIQPIIEERAPVNGDNTE